jgi:hypothetical protein
MGIFKLTTALTHEFSRIIWMLVQQKFLVHFLEDIENSTTIFVRFEMSLT